MKTCFSVNVNKVALIRNSRGHNTPNLIEICTTILNAGADGITVHPRPDQRHITYKDCLKIKNIFNFHPNKEFNIEGNPFEVAITNRAKNQYIGFMEILKEALPNQATLVPDASNQLTSDHGWDLEKNGSRLEKIITTLKQLKIRTSLFIDVSCPATHILPKIGAERVELYTEDYAKHFNTPQRDTILKQYVDKASEVMDLGLEVNAGHDLNQENLATFLTAIPQIREVSIGHALICESLYDGIEPTVKNYLQCFPK